MFTLRTLLRPYHLLSIMSLTVFVTAISWDPGQTAPVNRPVPAATAEADSSAAGKDWISLPYSYQGPSRLLHERFDFGAIRHVWAVPPANPA